MTGTLINVATVLVGTLVGTLLGARLPPDRAAGLRDRAAHLPGADWPAALGAVADLLDFRHTMLEELR